MYMFIYGISRDNGEENRSYFLGLRVSRGLGFRMCLGVWGFGEFRV